MLFSNREKTLIIFAEQNIETIRNDNVLSSVRIWLPCSDYAVYPGGGGDWAA